ncbi:MAG: PaaI family thioesterase [Thermodesulfobacteriota bacterium]
MNPPSTGPVRPAGVETGDASGRAGHPAQSKTGMPPGRGARTFETLPASSMGREHGHSRCLLCGEANPWSLRLRFEPDGQGGVTALFKSHPGLQGYRGILHGGVSASLLDAAMTHCLFHHGIEALTADLHVRYAHAIPCDAVVELKARLVSSRNPLHVLRAEISLDGRLMAWGEAKFLNR